MAIKKMADCGDPDDDGDFSVSTLTPELVQAVSGPVGFIVLNWGIIEQALVAQIEAVGHLGHAVGLTVRRQGALSDRLKVMRSLLEHVPELSTYKGPATALLNKVAYLQSLRHMLVHGGFQAYLHDEELLVFNRLQPTTAKDGHMLSQDAVKIGDLQNAVNEIAEVRSGMMTLASSLMKDFGRD